LLRQQLSQDHSQGRRTADVHETRSHDRNRQPDGQHKYESFARNHAHDRTLDQPVPHPLHGSASNTSQLLRIRVWKRLQYHGINHAEDSRVGLDAESERKWGDGGDLDLAAVGVRSLGSRWTELPCLPRMKHDLRDVWWSGAHASPLTFSHLVAHPPASEQTTNMELGIPLTHFLHGLCADIRRTMRGKALQFFRG
jgi:hypothetical protein